jgi:hypothetical protein
MNVNGPPPPPHTTERPSDAREVTTGVWLVSRDQFDAVHADFQLHSYVTPVHCRTSLLIHHAIPKTSAGMCFLGCSRLIPDVKVPAISLDIGPLLAPIVCSLSVKRQDQLVLQHWVYRKIHILSHEIWCNESTTNKYSWRSRVFLHKLLS